jgi:flagellar biosynthesis anti-sigma factor FlgM
MRIDLGLQADLPIETARSGRASAGGSSSTAAADSAATDQAQLTSVSTLVKMALSAGTEVRSERLDDLRNQVRAGTYRVDANQVADAMYRELPLR